MAADLKASTYLVDGTDLQVPGVELLHDGSGLWAGIAENVGVATSAGEDGGTVSGGVFPPFTHSTLFEVTAANAQAVWAAIVALRRRCKPGHTVTLTRRMPDPDGSDANLDLTTMGRAQGNPAVEWVERNNRAQVDIDWLIVGGPWLGAQVAIADASGAHTIKGDLRARKITATLSAGAVDPVVTNASNGYSFRYIGTVPAGDVLVDVAARTATGITGSVPLSSNLRWSKDAPFQLEAGANTVTVSSGSCALSYYPAYA